MTTGIGFDVKLSKHIAIRPIQAEYFLIHFRDPRSFPTDRTWQNNIRLSSGLVFRFGGDSVRAAATPSNRAPVASCSADKIMVKEGSGDEAMVRADASDPDGDPLTYTWTATGGAVEGSGPAVRWISTGLKAGIYTVKARVDDGKGSSAECFADVRIEAPANRPPVISCSADRSPILPGETSDITADASDTDNDPLTYSYAASGGQITGSGPKVKFDSTGLQPGSYLVKCSVSDGRGGIAEASTSIDVQQLAAAVEAAKASQCEYRTAVAWKPDNVCKRILDDLALRLRNEPRASTVIVSYPHSTAQLSAKLAQTRADDARRYLGEKGIDASRIGTRAGQWQASEESKNGHVDIIWVPEGATY
ncbi:MAG: hypothetical protein NVS9B4_02440 [Candidatus Acidiferrum sp.]